MPATPVLDIGLVNNMPDAALDATQRQFRALLRAAADEGLGRRLRQEPEGGFAHHLSFSVDSPNSTSIMVMIQKRTTTWLSFQPSSS